jgi:hypothetical protein
MYLVKITETVEKSSQTVKRFLSTIEVWTEFLINTNIMTFSTFNNKIF